MNFSIIIPHKNTPELLNRCIESIPYRDDLEIIIVDDNSSDSIVNFDAFPGANRKNTKCIFNKEGRGAGYARNLGLSEAKGYWVYFMDADDYVTDAFSEILDKYAKTIDIDMVFLNALSVDENGIEKPLSINKYISNYYQKKRFALSVLRYGFWAPWSRIIKREIMVKNHIQFEEVATGNDVMGIVSASKFAKTFAAEEQVCYMYYKPSGGSQTSAAYNEETYIQRLEQKFKLNQIYREVSYPFLWPIAKAFDNKIYNQTAEVKNMKNKYNYSLIEDAIIYMKYFVAKVLNIL